MRDLYINGPTMSFLDGKIAKAEQSLEDEKKSHQEYMKQNPDDVKTDEKMKKLFIKNEKNIYKMKEKLNRALKGLSRTNIGDILYR